MGHIGKTIVNLEKVDSTNCFAERLMQNERVDEGLVIQAEYQSKGRGQGNNQWQGEAGANLLLSVILFPTFLPPEWQFQLNKAMTLGILDFLNDFTEGAAIKWPNDLMVNGKKIAGMLIQHTVAGEQLVSSIIGIGINVNQRQFPSSLPDAISLQQLMGHALDKQEALNRLCFFLDARYAELKSGDAATLNGAYRDNLLDFQVERVFHVGGEVIVGTITGVDSVGRLLVNQPGKRLTAYAHGEIQL